MVLTPLVVEAMMGKWWRFWGGGEFLISATFDLEVMIVGKMSIYGVVQTTPLRHGGQR